MAPDSSQANHHFAQPHPSRPFRPSQLLPGRFTVVLVSLCATCHLSKLQNHELRGLSQRTLDFNFLSLV